MVGHHNIVSRGVNIQCLRTTPLYHQTRLRASLFAYFVLAISIKEYTERVVVERQ